MVVLLRFSRLCAACCGSNFSPFAFFLRATGEALQSVLFSSLAMAAVACEILTECFPTIDSEVSEYVKGEYVRNYHYCYFHLFMTSVQWCPFDFPCNLSSNFDNSLCRSFNEHPAKLNTGRLSSETVVQYTIARRMCIERLSLKRAWCLSSKTYRAMM